MLTLTQWIHQTKEQSDNVSLLVNMMKESAQSQSKLREDVEAMAIQVRIFFPPSFSKIPQLPNSINDQSDEHARIQMGGRATGLPGGGSTKSADDPRPAKGELEIEGECYC